MPLGAGCPAEPPGGEPDLRRPSGPDGGPRPDLGGTAGPGWHWESPLPQGNHLRGVTGVAGPTAAADELWLAGDSGTLWHRQRAGTAWAPEATDVLDTRALLGIAASGSGNAFQVLGVGIYDLAVQSLNGRWSEAPAPVSSAGSLTAVWGSQVGGEFYVVGSGGRVYHVRGTSWTQEASGLVSQYLDGVWGRGAGPTQEVWAVGASGKVLHKKGDTWALEAEGLTTQQLTATYGVGADVYAVGDAGVILHRQGEVWTLEPTPSPVNLSCVWGAGDEVFAAGARGVVLRRSAGAWRAETIPVSGELLSAMWGTARGGQNTVYVAGNLGTLLRREQGTWTALSARVTTGPLSSVWARSVDEVYAVGAGGVILRRRGTAPVGAWSPESEGATTESLNAVSGWAPAQGEAEVYAVGTGGTILHRQAGTWNIEGAVLTGQELTAVWVGEGAVYAVGRGGRVARKAEGKWTLERLPTGVPDTDLLGVWGIGKGDAQTVYAVGAAGLVLRRSAGVWAREAAGMTTEVLTGVFGRGEEVYVLGIKGAALRRVAGAWNLDALPLGARAAVAGAASVDGSSLYVVATGGVMLRRGGGSWGREPSLTGQELTSVTAGTGEDAFAVGTGGIILHRY